MNTLEFPATQSGPAETIIFLHGGNVAGWMWGEQVPAFTDYHVLVPDLPGFGTSNDEAWPGLAGTADAVAALIREKAHDSRAHVVGLSLGASVAVEVALRHPDVTASLFLASAAVTPLPRSQTLATNVMLAFWHRPSFWRVLARSYGLPSDSVELFVTTGLGISTETARAVYREVVLGIDPERLAAITAPTLAVAGAKDVAAISRDSLARLAATVAGVAVARAPGMHHQWNIENVPLFNAAVRAWVERREIADGLERFGDSPSRVVA